jgi:hypothetical protein
MGGQTNVVELIQIFWLVFVAFMPKEINAVVPALTFVNLSAI